MNRQPVKPAVRAVVSLAMLVGWTLAATTGFILYLMPHGRGSGAPPTFLLSRHEWGDVHFWICVGCVALTVAHIILTWRSLVGCVRHLTGTRDTRNVSKGHSLGAT